MKERPILLNAEMVRAVLDGRKTQTRRVVNWRSVNEGLNLQFSGLRASEEPSGWVIESNTRTSSEWRCQPTPCPFGAVGDRLWVITMKPISFGDGKYAAGDDGHIYDVSGVNPVRRRVSLGEKGYEELGLRFKGKQQRFRVNRLVAEAFYGSATEENPICRHLDGNKRNNTPENLDWGTSAQNSADANAAGAWSGEANGSSTLSERSVIEIRDSKEPQSILAERYGVSQPTISKIKNGKRWPQRLPKAPPANHERWASRITLEITGVRVERLASISNEDAAKEGYPANPEPYGGQMDQWLWFRQLWDDIYPEQSFKHDPWVWVIEFKRVEANHDN